MGQVKITFYTDPLCCWSWAFEEQWRKLLDEKGDQIEHSYVMCGMIRDWDSYSDPVNSVTKPFQMGPVWMHASQVTHVPMKYSLWHEDPPSSSYPACIAVKTARLQSELAEDKYLYCLRKALMQDGLNISREEVIMSVAEHLDGEAGFHFDAFHKDWKENKGKALFRSDLQQARFHNIGRYPTLTLTDEKGKGIVMVGYRPYDVLHKAFEHVLNSSDQS